MRARSQHPRNRTLLDEWAYPRPYTSNTERTAALADFLHAHRAGVPHKLARDVCHGKRGTIHQAYRDGMEDQVGALGLVLNAIVLWTTKYIDAAVARLQAEGHELREEDIARLSRLKHRNLNLLGRYRFTASTPAAGALGPLRDPDGSELDEDDGDEA